jgi:peptidoglycan/LPS O-acetylase OafA/YrhL
MHKDRAENSYDFVRFCAASAVLFSHQFALAGFSEPPVPIYGADFGKLAVAVFFSLSGFQSLQKSADLADFLAARVLRIFPNLALALIASSTAALIWHNNYEHLWLHAKYVICNMLMLMNGVTHGIPGVFVDAAEKSVNGAL